MKIVDNRVATQQQWLRSKNLAAGMVVESRSAKRLYLVCNKNSFKRTVDLVSLKDAKVLSLCDDLSTAEFLEMEVELIIKGVKV
jgi:hypothetical protein